ncbi:MAG: glycosyltransferase family 4 protein, partial [Gemmatimonadales bacterium]
MRIQRMAEVLGQRGHEIHLVTYHLGDPLPAAPPYRLYRTRRLPTYQKQSPGPALQKLLVVDPFLARLLRRVLREHRVDLIHAHHYEGLLVARMAARRLGLPIIYDAHTLLGTELGHYVPGPLQGLAARTGDWLDRILPPRADHVISVSQAIRDHLVATGAMAADRITVIGNGVEQDHFDVGNGSRAEGERLIFTGNLAPYQGIDLLLQSFREVRALRRDVRLVIVSDSPFDPYEALAR